MNEQKDLQREEIHMNEELICKLTDIIKNSKHLVFFGGAGVSTESNIPDFRSSDGLYSERFHEVISPEELISHTFYMRFPEEFFSFYRDKLLYPDAKPNACHKALSKLEEMGILSSVITQNIDSLHQKAGSKKVLELHGSTSRNYCEECHTFYDEKYILSTKDIPRCKKCNGRVKPDVVLYEESLDEQVLNEAIYEISHADTLIIGGTSLVVYPAAGLIRYFKGENLILINKSETMQDKNADLVLHEPIGEVFKKVMENIG